MTTGREDAGSTIKMLLRDTLKPESTNSVGKLVVSSGTVTSEFNTALGWRADTGAISIWTSRASSAESCCVMTDCIDGITAPSDLLSARPTERLSRLGSSGGNSRPDASFTKNEGILEMFGAMRAFRDGVGL